MATLELKHLTITADGHQVVTDANFSLSSGMVGVLMGPNGSGKSSLLNALMGHPKFTIVEGMICLDGEDITTIPTEQKARRGIFLSLQHLPEIPGITLTHFLHKAYRAVTKNDMTPLDFYQMMEREARACEIDPIFLKRYLNTGLSGGEKKLSEALQLLALRPRFALLDEIDSGVDIDALKKIFRIVEQLRGQGTGFLIVSHHPKLLEHVTPDTVAVMMRGRIVALGGKELAERIAQDGFRSL